MGRRSDDLIQEQNARRIILTLLPLLIRRLSRGVVDQNWFGIERIEGVDRCHPLLSPSHFIDDTEESHYHQTEDSNQKQEGNIFQKFCFPLVLFSTGHSLPLKGIGGIAPAYSNRSCRRVDYRQSETMKPVLATMLTLPKGCVPVAVRTHTVKILVPT